MNYAIFKTLIYFFGNSRNVISSMESLDRQTLIYFDSDNLIANFIGLARLYNPQHDSVYSKTTFYGLSMQSQERSFILQHKNELNAADLNDFFQDLLEVIDKIKTDE